MFSPANIQKLWKRVNDRVGLSAGDGKAKGKVNKPTTKSKQAGKENELLEKKLTVLRAVGKGDLSDPDVAKKFLMSRDKVGQSLKKYCKLLKGDDLEGFVGDLKKFRKAVMQITVVVESLEARTYADDEAEPDLNALEKVNTSDLDKAMKDPKFGEFADDEMDEEESEEPEAEPVQVAPKAPPVPDNNQLPFTRRLQKLTPAFQQALKDQHPNRGELEKTMKLLVAAAKSQDYEQGLALLDKLEAELQ